MSSPSASSSATASAPLVGSGRGLEPQPSALRAALISGDLRSRTARGTVVNSLFQIAINALNLVKGFTVAALLTRSEFGIWAIIVIALGTLGWLRTVGISDKYIQQNEADQEAAFQHAFTMELIYSAMFLVLVAVCTPLFALMYGRPEIIAPGFLILLAIPAVALQAPSWVFYRDMNYVRQRTLISIDPVVNVVVTIVLAALGFGYWSLVIGFICGSWAGGIVCVIASPYPLRWRYNRGAVRSYAQFSWPLILAAISGIVVAQGSILVGQAAVGLAGVGSIALAAQIVSFTDGVDRIVTNTLYPAVCAVKDRADLLLESFVKSNRLGLMWGIPFGVGVALFASDLVRFGLGERWHAAIGIIAAFGLVAGAEHIGYNWDAFMRASNQTRPMAVAGGVAAAAFLIVATPLLLLFGLTGLAIGMGVLAGGQIALRAYYLRRLMPGLRIIRHGARAIAPSMPAAASVLLLRLAVGGAHTRVQALGELLLYLAVTVAATVIFERNLLRELVGYVRRPVRPGVVG